MHYQFNRQSLRLRGYDYSKEGLYFITICCQDRIHRFGKIVNGVMILNDAGKQAEICWMAIPEHFTNVVLHDFVIMPNHIHGIVEITAPSVWTNYHCPIMMKKTFSKMGRKMFRVMGRKMFRPYHVVHPKPSVPLFVGSKLALPNGSLKIITLKTSGNAIIMNTLSAMKIPIETFPITL